MPGVHDPATMILLCTVPKIPSWNRGMNFWPACDTHGSESWHRAACVAVQYRCLGGHVTQSRTPLQQQSTRYVCTISTDLLAPGKSYDAHYASPGREENDGLPMEVVIPRRAQAPGN